MLATSLYQYIQSHSCKHFLPTTSTNLMEELSSEALDSNRTLLITVSTDSKLNTYSLVLSSADISHQISYSSPTKIEIYVSSTMKDCALRELDTYEAENLNWPEQLPVSDFIPTFRAMSLIVIGFLIFIYDRSGDWSRGSEWFKYGMGNSEAILGNSEYYRLATALTLHADIVHLLGNCILGGFVVHFFLGLTGNGIGLFLLLFTGVLANLINVVAHGPGHHFVGFSTSIFSVIGMLCTISFSGKSGKKTWHLLLPIMSGLALLAFLGSSGPRTDLGGHFFGLAVGLIFGNIVRFKHFETLRKSTSLQFLLGCTTFIIVYLCWTFAYPG